MNLFFGVDRNRRPVDIRAKASAQAAGLGIGHLPRWLAEPEIAAGRLVEKERRQPGKALTWFLGELEKPEEIAALASGL